MPRQRRRSGAEIASALNCDPFKYLCRRFNAAEDGKEKDNLALELLPFVLPRLKAVEHSADDGSEVTITIGGKALPNEVTDTAQEQEKLH